MSRPSKLDDITVKKLEEAFSLGASIKEACFYADISKQTFYNWKEENPELFDRFELLQQSPILLARKTLVNALKDNPYIALKYLERKMKQEFSLKESPQKEETEPIDKIVIEVIGEHKPLKSEQELQDTSVCYNI